MKKLLHTAITICCTSAYTFAQQANDSILTVGSTLKNHEIRNVINYKKNKLDISDYSGKVIILDFWATWCTPCVASIPKLDSLQKKFGNEVQVLPVTYQDAKSVQRLFSKDRRLKNISLPFATSDETLRYMFPHKSLPHYIWINKEGKIVAITGMQEVNEENIKKVVDNHQVSFRVKKELDIPYDRELGLMFQEIGIEQKEVKFQSLLTNYKNGLSSRRDVTQYPNAKNVWRPQKISFLNMRIVDFFQLAWSDTGHVFSQKMIVVESKDSTKIKGPENASTEVYSDWLQDNGYCYELIVPDKDSVDVFEMMRQDMKRYYPAYSGSIEKRKMKCLVLERTSAIDKIKTKASKFSYGADQYGLSFTYARMGILIGQLGFYLQLKDMPVIDGTGYTGYIDINLPDVNVSDVNSLNEGMKKYDLQLVEKDYLIDVLIIKDQH